MILKPAPETRRTAWALANQLWEAGVPRDLLQYVACDDDEVGRDETTACQANRRDLTFALDCLNRHAADEPHAMVGVNVTVDLAELRPQHSLERHVGPLEDRHVASPLLR